jgi:hypothetical protein
VARVFLWECSYRGLQLAQLLGQLGVFLTWMQLIHAQPTRSCRQMAWTRPRVSMSLSAHLHRHVLNNSHDRMYI